MPKLVSRRAVYCDLGRDYLPKDGYTPWYLCREHSACLGIVGPPAVSLGGRINNR